MANNSKTNEQKKWLEIEESATVGPNVSSLQLNGKQIKCVAQCELPFEKLQLASASAELLTLVEEEGHCHHH